MPVRRPRGCGASLVFAPPRSLTGTMASTAMSIPPLSNGSHAVLCGGLGGSRFVDALTQAAGAERVTAIVNVGDDVEILGLHVSPDLDTVLYTLAGAAGRGARVGRKDETTNALQLAARLGGEDWFTLGDRDIGLHLVRTRLLREGVPLSEVTRRLCGTRSRSRRRCCRPPTTRCGPS